MTVLARTRHTRPSPRRHGREALHEAQGAQGVASVPMLANRPRAQAAHREARQDHGIRAPLWALRHRASHRTQDTAAHGSTAHTVEKGATRWTHAMSSH
jgi:hypothetical protein